MCSAHLLMCPPAACVLLCPDSWAGEGGFYPSRAHRPDRLFCSHLVESRRKAVAATGPTVPGCAWCPTTALFPVPWSHPPPNRGPGRAGLGWTANLSHQEV